MCRVSCVVCVNVDSGVRTSLDAVSGGLMRFFIIYYFFFCVHRATWTKNKNCWKLARRKKPVLKIPLPGHSHETRRIRNRQRRHPRPYDDLAQRFLVVRAPF